MTMLEDYFIKQAEATTKYGDFAVVFMQNGTFYESYKTDDEGFNINVLGELLNFMTTRKAGKSKPISRNTPYMLGIPVVTWNKHLKIMIENGYTILEIAETTPAPNPIRELVAIHSPATYTEEITNPESNYISSIYIEENNGLYICGIIIMDISTGKSYIYETQSKKCDNMIALDDIAKIIQSYQCKEVIVTTCNIISLTRDQMISYLEVADKLHFYNTADLHNDNIKKIKYQIDKFKNSFAHIIKNNTINIIEELGLENLTYGRIALVVLLNYIKDHCSRSIINLEIPKYIEKTAYMYLGNNAIYQLNIFNNDQSNISNLYYKGTKYKSLFSIINQTSTSMGRRFLKNNLINPLIDSDILNKRYNIIEKWSDGKCNELDKLFTGIPDIERLCRKIITKNIHPSDLYNCINGIELSYILIENAKLYGYFDLYDVDNILKTTNEFLNMIKLNVNINNLQLYTINDIIGPIFNVGIYPELDNKNNEIVICKNYMDAICSELNNILNTNVPKKKKKILDDNDEIEQLIKIGYTNRDGHYFELTKRRCEILENWFETNKLQIGNIEISKNNIEIKYNPTGSSAKIFMNIIKSKTEQIDILINELKIRSKQVYIEFLEEISHKYHKYFNDIVYVVSEIDFLTSGAKNVIKNGYKKPFINNNENKAYIKATAIRHPICEKLLIDTEYVPIDITLGKDDCDGILLFGLNSAGKSTLQKAIGINLILAQIGYFVAATTFEYYPYTTLMTRISGNDNMFKGLSSFALEANELKAIIKRSDQNTMIIADEVCRGTEHKGSLTVVLTMLEILLSKKSSFITATHLHDLLNYDRLNKMNKLHIYHLHLEYDEQNNIIKYDRILKKGPGQSEYGFQLAKHLINDPTFTILANQINDEINNIKNVNQLEKHSKYNSDVWMSECQICGYKPLNDNYKPLETHHINFQRDCDNNNFILAKPYIHKNHKSNLCVLCDKCHDKIDTGELVIYGYENTSNGNVLKYNINNIQITNNTTVNNNITNTVNNINNNTINNNLIEIDNQIIEMLNKKQTHKSIIDKLKSKSIPQIYIKQKIKSILHNT